MAKTHKRTMTLDLPPDDLVAVLTDPEYHVAREKAQDALDVRVQEVSRSGDRLVFEVHVTQHARGKTGIDRSRTEQAVTTTTWDLRARRASWEYRDPHSDRVTVRGTMKVEPAGERSTLVDEMHVEVRIPLIGGQIEKMILKGVEEGWPKYERVVRDFAARSKDRGRA
jgi:hypothetical protein